MTTPARARRPTAGRVAADLVRTTGDYVLLVLVGAFLCLVIGLLVGHLGPWLFSLGAIWSFAYLTSIAVLVFAPLGAALFVGARLLQLVGLPRRLLRALGALVSGFSSLYALAVMGGYIAFAVFPLYLAFVLGSVFGAYLLVPAEPGEYRPVRRRHWLSLTTPALVIVLWHGFR